MSKPIAAGMIVYSESSDNGRFLHQVIVVSACQVDAIDDVILNGYPIQNDHLDAAGNVIKGKYAGFVRIKKHLGAPGQQADPDLVREGPGWEQRYTLRGYAYLYNRYEDNPELFGPRRSPHVEAVIHPRAGLACDRAWWDFTKPVPSGNDTDKECGE